MEEAIKTAQIRYLECEKGCLHEGEQLNFICVDSGCKEAGIICSICRMDSHSKHKVMPLKIFLCEIASKMKSRSAQSDFNIDELLAQLDKLNQSILFSLKEAVENMAAAIKTFESECADTVKRLKEKVSSQVFMHENMPRVIESIIHNEYTDTKSLRAECKKLIDSITFSEKKGFDIDIKPERSIETFKLTEHEIIKTLHKTSKTFVESLKKLETSFCKAAATKEVPLVFTFG